VIAATGVVGVTLSTMSLSIASYRSSGSSSRRLRRILRSQEHDSVENQTAEAHNLDSRSRVHSHDFSNCEKPDSATKPPSVKSKRFQKESDSESPVMIFFRILFERCFTKRRKRRSRGMATRKMKNNNYQTRDDFDKKAVTGSGTSRSSTYSAIPTNEHEMFSMLHSKRHHRTPSGCSTQSPTHTHRRNNSGVTTALPPALLVIEQPLYHSKEHQQIFLS